ncbi:hypothetical protein F9278_26285 [Streptomyces phaeolivaceus]|uniref:Uncharacterized protein n=1 Tax=Streptomyces phaeolivaceus TaxID=2653200 RepID=A0A5P8KI39_9ACTN|nr:hypothetical protein F9278_26285 [Streptomyces phaeolivaceus]
MLLATLLVALSTAILPGSASADGHGDENGQQSRPSDHWGVITRNTIGSPVAELRNGPFGSFDAPSAAQRPPYGRGSLGIAVADKSTTLATPSEKVDFGNEIDFYGKSVAGLQEVGFHVFQTGENVGYGGGQPNMPNIRFEIDPNLAAPNDGINYSTLVWVPPASPVTNRWSPYLDAATSGYWYLTNAAAATATGCTQAAQCTFAAVKTALQDGGAPATLYSAAVGKGRDFMWIGAIDGFRVNETIYDFERWGVRALPAD